VRLVRVGTLLQGLRQARQRSVAYQPLLEGPYRHHPKYLPHLPLPLTPKDIVVVDNLRLDLAVMLGRVEEDSATNPMGDQWLAGVNLVRLLHWVSNNRLLLTCPCAHPDGTCQSHVGSCRSRDLPIG
jgi:hypothetical protein